MLTGEIRNQVDAIWNAFWTGGISNPLEVIEQITYLLFLRRLDELQTVEELKATRPVYFPRVKIPGASPTANYAGHISKTPKRARCSTRSLNTLALTGIDPGVLTRMDPPPQASSGLI
jgi:hypothetical protein